MNEAVEQTLDYVATAYPEKYNEVAKVGRAMLNKPSTPIARQANCEAKHQYLRNGFVEPEKPYSPEVQKYFDKLAAEMGDVDVGDPD
jgi:hypothetical protein